MDILVVTHRVRDGIWFAWADNFVGVGPDEQDAVIDITNMLQSFYDCNICIRRVR